MKTGLRLFPFLLLLSTGCGKGKPDDKPKKEDKPIVQSVEVGAGSTVVYQSATSDLPSFSLRWEAGGFDANKGGIDKGQLKLPSGDLFTNGKKASTYRADKGDADQPAKRLKMTGNVVVRSVDGTQGLKAAQMEYRGDVRLLRATGGVTASGPFGTLSGVPELWATPDLRLIGTPDMIGKALKIPALAALALSASAASPRLQGKDFEISGAAVGSKIDDRGANRLFTATPARGVPIVVSIKSRGIVMRFSETVVVEFVGRTRDARRMTTTGPVSVVQTKGDVVTAIDGQGAVYDLLPGAAAADLDLDGPVKVVRTAKVLNAEKKAVVQTTTTRGDKGHAVLLNDPKAGQDGLRNVVLTGNVTIDVSEVDGQKFSGAGARMVYTPNGETAGVEIGGRTTLTSVSKDKDGTRTTVAKGDGGTAVLFSKPAQGDNPLKNATLSGHVMIDVASTVGEAFKGSGDKIVYTALGGDKARAVMTGKLVFSGDTSDLIANVAGMDTAVMMLGKKGMEQLEMTNSNGTPGNASFDPKPKPKKTGGGP